MDCNRKWWTQVLEHLLTLIFGSLIGSRHSHGGIMQFVTVLVILIVLFFVEASPASEPLSPTALRGLPIHLGQQFTSKGEGIVFPELRVQSYERDSVPSIAIVALFRSSTFACPTFNSFGDFSSGRPYKVVMTDEDWNHVVTLIDSSDASKSILPQDNWINIPQNSVIGKCYWFNQALDARVRESKVATPLPLIPEKRYLLHLVVSRRALTISPLLGNRFERERRQTEWKDMSLDEFICRSEPVAIRISSSGKCQLDQSDGLPHSFANVQTECIINHDCFLELRTFVVNHRNPPKRALNPFMRRVNGTDPLSIDIRDSKNTAPESENPSGNLEPRRRLTVADSLDIPTDGVVGTIRQFYDPFPPGRYSVSVTCSGSIWQNDFPSNDSASIQAMDTQTAVQFVVPPQGSTVDDNQHLRE